MPNYEGWTLKEVRDAIEPGSAPTFYTVATDIGNTYRALGTLLEDIPAEVGKVVGTAWAGPASEVFTKSLSRVYPVIEELRTALANYEQELTNGGAALAAAKSVLAEQVEHDVWIQSTIASFKGTADYDAVRQALQAPFDASVRQTLLNLANEYRRVTAALKPIPEAVLKEPGGGSGPGDEDEDEGSGGGGSGSDDDDADAGGGGSQEEEEEEEESGGGGSGSGGGDNGSGGGGSGSGGGDEGLGGGGSGGGDEGLGGGGSGSGGGDEGTGGGDPGSGGGGSPAGSGGPLGDQNRALPDAPRAKDKNGVTGIDVDGDGVPDLGLDGKPLPDAKLVELDGRSGVDVDGDGRPDIGIDGEILPSAPIVQGPDGTIGIDVDGDGRPDVGISGQVLPDAPIVVVDGVRGVDVDGDGVPDLGMDRRPLPNATLVTVDGITGVDVNGDGKPDIGMKGEILTFAPMVSTPDGITGVDVNGDGKPDIAALGGLSVTPRRGADAIPLPELPIASLSTPTVPTSLTSAGLGGHVVTYAPDSGDSPTVLTSLGSALAGRGRPGGAEEATGPTHLGGAGGQPFSATPTRGHQGGDARARRWAAVARDDDAWHDDHGANSVLGRPSYDNDWED
ncbi:WXG100 family type VII secretion target [Micromonospora rubida]